MPFEMEAHYDHKYFFAEKFGGKRYIDTDGKVKEFGYRWEALH